MPSQLQEYEAGQLSVGREDGQETKEGQSQELNNGVEAEFEEAPQEISLVTFADHHTAGELELQSTGQLASAFGVPQETALKWLAPPRVAAAASRVGAVIFTPSSGGINYLGVGGQHSGCGAAAALLRFAEEAMQVADLFIVPGLGRRGPPLLVAGRLHSQWQQPHCDWAHGEERGASSSRGVPFGPRGAPPSRHPEKGAGCSGQLRLVPRRYRRFSSSDEHPPSPGLVRQGDSAFIIICIMCSFFPGSFGIVFSQLCNVFCVGPPSPPGALSSLSPLWGCMPLCTYKQLTSQLGSLLQPGPDSFHPWFHT